MSGQIQTRLHFSVILPLLPVAPASGHFTLPSIFFMVKYSYASTYCGGWAEFWIPKKGITHLLMLEVTGKITSTIKIMIKIKIASTIIGEIMKHQAGMMPVFLDGRMHSYIEPSATNGRNQKERKIRCNRPCFVWNNYAGRGR